MDFYHAPVLKDECLDALNMKSGAVFIDCTLGGGGHSEAILQEIDSSSKVIGLDRDLEALSHACERLKKFSNFESIHTPFSALNQIFEESSIDGILMDLGISSRQIDNGNRGFSFRNSEFVDLRMDQSQGVSAREWLIQTEKKDICQVLYRNADLRATGRFVDNIIAKANEGELLMSDFVALVRRSFPKLRDQEAACARILQAIRMEINNEMREVTETLDGAVKTLKVGGRLVVITYHSVEDRTVKHKMKEYETACICPPRFPICQCGSIYKKIIPINRKPRLPSELEIALNPRSRSAKLRVYERV